MIRLSRFVVPDLSEIDSQTCDCRFPGECYVDDWEPFRKPIGAQYGVMFGLTIIETEVWERERF